MQFVTIEELKIRKFEHLINDVSSDNNDILNELELMAIDEVTSYLRPRYSTDYIFSRTGSARSPIIRRITTDYIMCYLWERTNSNEIPESLQERCEKNTQWLMDVSTGKISPDLPVKDPALEGGSNVFQGSSEPIFNDTNNLD